MQDEQRCVPSLCIKQDRGSTPAGEKLHRIRCNPPRPSVHPALKIHYKHIFCSKGEGTGWFMGNIMYKRSRLQQIQQKKRHFEKYDDSFHLSVNVESVGNVGRSWYRKSPGLQL